MNTAESRSATPVPGPIARIEDVVTGAVVVLVGLVLLIGNVGLRLPFALPDRWWALFILVGAVAPAYRALVRYRLAGRVDAEVAHRVASAVAIVSVALMFLLDVSFATWWPAFLVIGGLCTMFPGRRRAPRRRDRA